MPVDAPGTQVLVGPLPLKWQAEPSAAPIAVQVLKVVALPSPQAVAVMQVLVGPVPTKWQPMPSSAPMAEQVARLVVLPSVHWVAAGRGQEHVSVRVNQSQRHESNTLSSNSMARALHVRVMCARLQRAIHKRERGASGSQA